MTATVNLDQLAARLAAAAGADLTNAGPDVAYHWLAEAEQIAPAIAADRADLARWLDRCATHANLEARRHAPDTPERIARIAEWKTYRWAARIVRGEAG